MCVGLFVPSLVFRVAKACFQSYSRFYLVGWFVRAVVCGEGELEYVLVIVLSLFRVNSECSVS